MIDTQSAMTCHTLEGLLPDEAATAQLASHLARLLRCGDVVLLTGDLGAGKTAFCRALIRSMADAALDVPSPTFTLVQTYETDHATLWHFDLYRLSGPEEMEELGWDEAREDGVCLVEWPDRLGPLTPIDRLDVSLVIAADGLARQFRLTGWGQWKERLTNLAWPPPSSIPAPP